MVAGTPRRGRWHGFRDNSLGAADCSQAIIKALCAEKQWPPHTFSRKKVKALANIAHILNARGVPVS
jgi:hypothetical protein